MKILKKLNFFVPLFFEKEPIPHITNQDLLGKIKEVSQQKDSASAMQYSLDILAKKYESRRLESVLQLWKLFQKNPNTLWKRTGFMHCTQQNYLLRILLVKSNKIKDEDIRLGYSLVWYISPHQYLIVKYKGKDLALDPWNYDKGAQLGLFASGLGMESC